MTAAKESTQEKPQAENKISLPNSGEWLNTNKPVNGRLSNFFSRFRREQEAWLEIEGYLAQDLRTEEPVTIKKDSTLLGNVYAPKILVEGTLSGSAYGREIEVASGGQIWGDVFAITLNIAPGGKVQGWVSSIEEDDLEQIQVNGSLIDDVKLSAHVEAINENLDTGFLARNDTQMESLHLLQTELAATLAARYEMEQGFERRLTEMAGEAYSKINTLTEQLTTVRAELTAQKAMLDSTQETARQQKSQIERQTNELTVARELMTDQNHELSELRDLYNNLRQNHEKLEAEKAEADTALNTTVKEQEALTERVENLETAHLSNLQYQADQKDSLIRWQELAEVTEKRAAELETELQKLQFQFEENDKTVKMLRDQRRDLDLELEKTLGELRSLQESKTRPLVDAQALAEASEKIIQLENAQAASEQEYMEHLIWYKANLETSRSELEKAREMSVEQTENMRRLEENFSQAQTQINVQQEQIDNLHQQNNELQTEVRQWQTAVSEKEITSQKQTEELHQTIINLKSDRKNMQTTLRENRLQLEATEHEVERYLAETKAQGERLADIHAQLVERDIQLQKAHGQLKKARTMIEKQNQVIKQMKQITSDKIRAMQAEINRLKK